MKYSEYFIFFYRSTTPTDDRQYNSSYDQLPTKSINSPTEISLNQNTNARVIILFKIYPFDRKNILCLFV